ncbi:hypothetical protein IW261DRAFT_924609 [Armillaria novae-zelandiae]|uniref:Uncharacterized protein n=1 Tax=Armillaria novae-zelandiae TaxID=153914 RepID=A0AA39NS27_9AGAR|nr:hypothetical protein IW261DRAFT_924609 [Armillaria novae-zelandiae]
MPATLPPAPRECPQPPLARADPRQPDVRVCARRARGDLEPGRHPEERQEARRRPQVRELLQGAPSVSVSTPRSRRQIYRHPSCLIKHRWEHTPHWRESSKYVLSKHQQVQLLEAAAILSHLKSESLPEDRSLWPSFLSGGPPAASSSSVPVGGRAGPRMHDYDVQPGTPMEVLAPRFEYGSVGESVPESDEDDDDEGEDEMSEDDVWEDKAKQEAEEWDGFDMDMD